MYKALTHRRKRERDKEMRGYYLTDGWTDGQADRQIDLTRQ